MMTYVAEAESAVERAGKESSRMLNTFVAEAESAVERAGDDSSKMLGALERNRHAAAEGVGQAARLWSDAFGGPGLLGAWQAYARAVAERMAPAVRKSAEAWIRLGEQGSRLNAEVVEAAVGPNGAGLIADAAARTGRVWQETVEAAQDTLGVAARANADVVGVWSDALTATEAAPVTEDAIRRLAHELWERKGRREGYVWEDWFEAEAALKQAGPLAP